MPSVSTSEFIEAVEKVHTFYSDSFTSLLAVTFGLVAFVGVVFPLFISILQSRQLKEENKALRQELERHVAEASKRSYEELETQLEEKKKSIDNHVDAKLGEFKARLGTLTSESTGSIFHLQANSSIDKGDYTVGMRSYCVAVMNYLKADNMADMRVVAKLIIQKCLPNITKENFEEDSAFGKDLDKIKAALEGKNSNGVFTDLISDLEKQIASSKKRSRKADV